MQGSELDWMGWASLPHAQNRRQPTLLNRNVKDGIGDQLLFVGAGDIDRWAHAFSAWEHAKEDKYSAFGIFLGKRLSAGTMLEQNHPLGSMTTMGVGGNTRWYAEPANTEDLSSLVEACKLFELPRAMMGRGSNLIVPDDGFGGLVLKLRGKFWSSIEQKCENSLMVGAGAKLKDICKYTCRKGLKGFEFLEGIDCIVGKLNRIPTVFEGLRHSNPHFDFVVYDQDGMRNHIASFQ